MPTESKLQSGVFNARHTWVMTFVVLFVCTGNVCRSPAAELLFRAAVDPDADVAVHSAGMMALEGVGVDPPSAAALSALGIDVGPHRARQFEPAMAAAADLVLTAERVHRDEVMTEVPTALRRTFTMREFARLAPLASAGEPRAVVAELARRRGESGLVDELDDSILDPFRKSAAEAMATLEQVQKSVRATVTALGLPRRASGRFPFTKPGRSPGLASAAPRRPRPGLGTRPRPGPHAAARPHAR